MSATNIRKLVAARIRAVPDRSSIEVAERRFTRQGATVLEVGSSGWSRWSLADPRHELDNDAASFERLWKKVESALLSA